MAGSKQTQEDPTCAICFEDFRDPVKLPCQHTYCRECIRTHAEKSKPADTSDGSDSSTIPKQDWIISCPLCRKEASLGTDGVDGLPENMHLAGMVDKPGKAEENDEELCVTHNKPLIMFCEACHKLICIECLREHGGHPMRDKDTVYRKLKGPFVKKTEDCKEVKDKMVGFVSEMKDFVEDIEGNENRHRAEVERAYSQGLEVLNTWRKDALSCIENRHSTLTRQTQTAIAELAAKLPEVEQTIQDARYLPTSLTEAFLTMSTNMTSRMDDLMPEVTDFMKNQEETKMKMQETLKLDPALPIHLNAKLNTVTVAKMKFNKTNDTSLMIENNGNTVKLEHGSAKWSTAWTDSCIQTGCHFWQIQVSLSPSSRQPDEAIYICTAGVMHDDSSSWFDTAGVNCWWIGIAQMKDECRLESPYGKVKEPYGKLAPYQNTYTLGFCVQCETGRLTFVDCVQNDLLLTVKNLDVSKPLVLAVSFNAEFVESASARLVTGDSMSPPSVLWSIL